MFKRQKHKRTLTSSSVVKLDQKRPDSQKKSTSCKRVTEDRRIQTAVGGSRKKDDMDELKKTLGEELFRFALRGE